MNVIFLDLDGVIFTLNMNVRPYEKEDAMENRIRLLSEICHIYDCKVVISSTKKELIKQYLDKVLDEEEIEKIEWLPELFELFKKYDIEIYGVTPTIRKRRGENVSPVEWKEYEIGVYTVLHPEVKHVCVIDDDDFVREQEKGDFSKSDLNTYRDYLIVTKMYSSTNPSTVGLQPYHVEEAGKILQKNIE